MFAYTGEQTVRLTCDSRTKAKEEATQFAEVQELTKVVVSDSSLCDKGKIDCGPFHSPGQLSDISTVADSCLELDDLDDENWDSDHDGPTTDGLSGLFPTISAFFDKHPTGTPQARKSLNAWGAVGQRLASMFSSSKLDNEEDLPSKNFQEEKSLQAWGAVGQKLASTLSMYQVDSDEEDSPCTTPQVKRSLEGWREVGQRLASTLSSCDVDSDHEDAPIAKIQSPRSLQDLKNASDAMKAWRLVGSSLAQVFKEAAEEEDDWPQ